MIPTTRALFFDSCPAGYSSVNSPMPQTNPSSYNHGNSSAAHHSPAHQNHTGFQNPTSNHLNASGTFRGLNSFNATQTKQLGSGQIQSSFLVSPCNADALGSPVSNLFDRMNKSSVSNNYFPNDLSTKKFGDGDIRHSPIQTNKPLAGGYVAPLRSGSSQGDLFRWDKGPVSAASQGIPEMPQPSNYDNVSTCQTLHTVASRYKGRFPDKSLKIQAVESVSNRDADLHTLSSPSDGYSSRKASIGSSHSKIVSALDLDSGIDQDFTESEEPLPCDRKTEQVLSLNGSKSSSYSSTTLPQFQNTKDVHLTVFTRDAAPKESSEIGTSEFVNKTFQYPSGDGRTGSLPCRVKNQTLVTVQKPIGPTEAVGSSGRSEASNPMTSLKFQKASSEAARRIDEKLIGIGSVLQIKNNSSELPAYDGPRLISMEKIRDNLDSGSLPHPIADANEKTNACRLARRLYELDGFRKSDVAKHLGKRSDFAQLVRQAYLQQFDFSSLTLDVALRQFLTHLVLSGETQERERILAEFSRRFVECNPHVFGSQDSCHMLVCGIMLLNTDLHGESDRKKMTVHEFVENLSGLNGGANFPKDLLKSIYNSIKNQPIEFATDEADSNSASTKDKQLVQSQANPFLDVPDPTKAREFKTGYLMRKCCLESDGRRMPLGKRGWKMFYASLRDLVLYLHKDEHGFSSEATFDDTSNAIRIHHSLAKDASDYAKRQYVFRVRAADWSEYLFQASNSDDCQAWIDAINQVAAALSAPPLPGAVGSQMKFQRPLMPSTRTKLSLKDQLAQHQQTLVQTEKDLVEHRGFCPEKGSRQRTIQDYVEKEAYLEYEKGRFQTYCTAIEKLILSSGDPNKSLTNDGYFQRTKASQASCQMPRKLKDGSDCFEAEGEKRNLSPGMAHASSVPHYLGHYPAKSVPALLFESRV